MFWSQKSRLALFFSFFKVVIAYGLVSISTYIAIKNDLIAKLLLGAIIQDQHTIGLLIVFAFIGS